MKLLRMQRRYQCCGMPPTACDAVLFKSICIHNLHYHEFQSFECVLRKCNRSARQSEQIIGSVRCMCLMNIKLFAHEGPFGLSNSMSCQTLHISNPLCSYINRARAPLRSASLGPVRHLPLCQLNSGENPEPECKKIPVVHTPLISSCEYLNGDFYVEKVTVTLLSYVYMKKS